MVQVILKKKPNIWAESWHKSPRNGGQLGRTLAFSGLVSCEIQKADQLHSASLRGVCEKYK